VITFWIQRQEIFMRILGAGFVGSHVVDVLIGAGHHVSIVDNLWEHGGGKLENINPKAMFYRIDICEAALSEVFQEERPEIICHLAAQHSVKISTDDPLHDANQPAAECHAFWCAQDHLFLLWSHLRYR
jgi:UDP-glucose 4-epimerase